MNTAPVNLLLACSVYAIGVASPGPSNLAIMGTAMDAGRKPALVLSLGIISGSLLWGLLAALGLSALLAAYAGALIALKLMGGLYLLWLAFRSARSALRPHAAPAAVATGSVDYRRVYVRGALMHVTNPKAIFVWLSLVSLAVPPGAGVADALRVVGCCIPIGAAIFCAYALAFSTGAARRAYLAVRRGFEASLALVFGYAGIRLLGSTVHPASQAIR